MSAFPVGLDVTWFHASAIELSDPYLKNWLLDTGSLTERVQSLCRHFSLTLLGQHTSPLHPAERTLLNDANDEDYEVREVLLVADGVPWVFARSVIPQRLIQQELANLGQEPLGKRLFNDPRFTRTPFELCQLDAHKLDSLHKVNREQRLWGRRSLFSFNHTNMIVAEVFLPDAPAYAKG